MIQYIERYGSFLYVEIADISSNNIQQFMNGLLYLIPIRFYCMTFCLYKAFH